MPHEIERKFLVTSDEYKESGGKTHIQQGFLSLAKKRVVRIRITGDKAMLTVKGISRGAKRIEFEYEIPVGDAEIMIEKLCKKGIIDKYRYIIHHENNIWEVDEFLGDNKGLVIAEIELTHEDQSFEKPRWVGKEITHDPRYFNANLAKKPFSDWPAK